MAIEGNVGLAFALVIAAGLCTALGATLVFCTSVANQKVLAGALGASAGVMMYVSMVEIFTSKAVATFQDAGLSPDESMRYATFSFFLGVLATWLLGKLVNFLDVASRHLKAKKAHNTAVDNSPPPTTASNGHLVCSSPLSSPKDGPPDTLPSRDVEAGAAPSQLAALPPAPQGQRPAGTLSATSSHYRKDVDVAYTTAGDCLTPPNAELMLSCMARSSSGACCEPISSAAPLAGGATAGSICDGSSCEQLPAVPTAAPPDTPPLASAVLPDHHAADLARMGLLTCIAVGLHNLPEGLATFVATLASPSTGIAIAVAIALHNIPEGVVVAMPIYYATKSKWRAFAWSFVSGAAEPIGGLLGYAVLAGNGMSPLAFAIMFGFVAGMMVYISLRELLPTALRYDPADQWVTLCCIWGMAVMASSLLLFRV